MGIRDALEISTGHLLVHVAYALCIKSSEQTLKYLDDAIFMMVPRFHQGPWKRQPGYLPA